MLTADGRPVTGQFRADGLPRVFTREGHPTSAGRASAGRERITGTERRPTGPADDTPSADEPADPALDAVVHVLLGTALEERPSTGPNGFCGRRLASLTVP